MARTATSFRVGRVRGYQRGKVWYLCYFEQGQRKRPRVGSDRDAARMLAAQTNAQITVGAPGVLSFEPVAIAELRQRWLNHHEQVLRSSVSSIWRDAGAADADRIRTTFIHLTARIGLPEATAPKLLRHTFATCLQDANVDPLIRNQLMGHRPADGSKPGGGLGMTAVYTHSRPETIRQQLGMAMAKRGIVSVDTRIYPASARRCRSTR